MAALRRLDPRAPRELIPAAAGRGRIVFTEKFLGAAFARAAARDMFAAAAEATRPEVVVRGGRRFELARRTAFFGEGSYRYAGVAKRAAPWGTGAFGRAVDRVRRDVEARTGRTFTFAIVNYYADGNTALSYHADDETDLDPTAPIVSVSFGAARDMLFKFNADGRGVKPLAVTLAEGSLVEMHPPLQQHCKHSIPVRKRVAGARINITFRTLRAAAATKKI